MTVSSAIGPRGGLRLERQDETVAVPVELGAKGFRELAHPLAGPPRRRRLASRTTQSSISVGCNRSSVGCPSGVTARDEQKAPVVSQLVVDLIVVDEIPAS